MSERRDDPWLFDLPIRKEDGDEDDVVAEPVESPVAPPATPQPATPPPATAQPAAPQPAAPQAASSGGSPHDELPLFPEDPPGRESEAGFDLESEVGPGGEPEREPTADPPAWAAAAPTMAPPDDSHRSAPYPAPAPAAAEPSAGAAPTGPVVAPLKPRLVAILGDGVLLATVLGVSLLGSAWLGGPTSVARHAIAFAAFLTVFSFVYSVVSLAFWGQTPGMGLAGVIARAGRDQPLTFGQTGLRWLAGWLTVALVGLPLLLLLTNRSLADRLSGSTTYQA